MDDIKEAMKILQHMGDEKDKQNEKADEDKKKAAEDKKKEAEDKQKEEEKAIAMKDYQRKAEKKNTKRAKEFKEFKAKKKAESKRQMEETDHVEDKDVQLNPSPNAPLSRQNRVREPPEWYQPEWFKPAKKQKTQSVFT